jgi:DNA-binding PadR family transcriptional regulator
LDDLERQYLLTAYDLAMENPQGEFYDKGIAASFDDVGYGPDSDEELVAVITRNFLRMGLIETVEEDIRLSSRPIVKTSGRRALRLTEAGKGESEKLMDPIEQRKELRRNFLRAVYEEANGSPSEFVYWRNVAPRLGITDSDEPSQIIMGVIDHLADSGFITSEVDEGIVYRITSAGIRQVEDNPSGYDRRPDFVPGSAMKLAPQPFIDSTPDEFSSASSVGEPPVEIQESLNRFKADYPDPDKVAFIMMQFGQTRAHAEITEAVRDCLAEYGIEGVRADGKRYHDNLFYNVLTYLHGCGMGIAIYEGIDTQANNPNVALEVGYLFAMRKPVCHLKDQKLSTLPSDLVGQLYDPFDTYDPAATIPPALSKWISDKGLA